MKLPKRTNYKGYLLISALVLTLSTGATLGGDLAANALSLPFGLGELGKDNKKKDTSDDKKVDDPQPTKAVVQPATPATPSTSNTSTIPATTTASSATKTVASAKSTAVTAPVVRKVDTAAQVTQVATAQAVKSIKPTVYQSDKITTDTRDELYKVAAIVVAVGALLYLLSYTRPWRWMYHNLVEAPKTVTQ